MCELGPEIECAVLHRREFAAPVTEPTAADVMQAREVEYRLDLDDSDDGAQSRVDVIAQALAAVRAEERARCVALVQQGTFTFQSEPPVAVTVERLEALRAQIAALIQGTA